ncbi:hypothetical protein HY990_03010 [Candidatus Micrarchaeota archaeon]|nr:hypothetical protein [Candidatus Micrarchaeota archaeon]
MTLRYNRHNKPPEPRFTPLGTVLLLDGALHHGIQKAAEKLGAKTDEQKIKMALGTIMIGQVTGPIIAYHQSPKTMAVDLAVSIFFMAPLQGLGVLGMTIGKKMKPTMEGIIDRNKEAANNISTALRMMAVGAVIYQAQKYFSTDSNEHLRKLIDSIAATLAFYLIPNENDIFKKTARWLAEKAAEFKAGFSTAAPDTVHPK